ncbi:MAG: hypothetical protein WAN43_02325 [Rhodomicrobium sp.]|jgi:hypothetical protein
MFTTRKSFVGVTAAAVLGALCAACGGDMGNVSLPGLNFKETFMGKPAPEPNLQDRAPLVMPPPNAALPVPGQSQTAANPQWPADSDQAKK